MKHYHRIVTILKYIWRSSPGWTLINGLLLLVRGVLPLLLLYLVKLLVDEIQIMATAGGGDSSVNHLIGLLVIAAAVFLFNALSASLGTLVREKQSFVI
jgi:ATP-binding cassette subfamily B protein